MSNPETRKGQSLEQSLSEMLEPVSHCASDCVARHSSHRLLYDQTHVLRGSLVFMESRIDSCAKSIQTDRHHPQYLLSRVGTDRQTPTQLGYRLGTRQTWSRVSFSPPTHQTDRSDVGIAYFILAFLLFQLCSDIMSVDGVVSCFPSVSVPVLSL